MIAYNKTWLSNQRLQDEMRGRLKAGLITADEFAAIAQKYPVGFYAPNLFIKAGLFILGLIIVLFSHALLCFMVMSTDLLKHPMWYFFLGLLNIAGVELFIRRSKHHHSGVDDALIVGAAALCGGAVYFQLVELMATTDFNLLFSAWALIMCAGLTMRYANLLAATAATVALLAVAFFGSLSNMPFAALPFIMIVFSGGLYALTLKLQKDKELINYQGVITVVQLVALLAFYASGNYFVIDELGSSMTDKTGPPPLGWFFWTWTIAIPFIYIIRGLKAKAALPLRTGLVLIAIAVLTYRNYFHILPADVALTIGGAVVLLLVYAVSRYLKEPKRGFTLLPPADVNTADELNVQAFIVAETFSHGQATPQKTSHFGGGSFGGGGSSGDF